MAYATSIDGSVMHVTHTGTPSGDLEDRTIKPASLTRRTLLEANPRCMSKVEGLRAEIMEEREQEEGGGRGPGSYKVEDGHRFGCSALRKARLSRATSEGARG
ncbi:unnamed protein product [Ectocarpus sp. 13 AM-2016]